MPLCLRDVICAEKGIKGLSEKLCVSGLFDITKVLRHGALKRDTLKKLQGAMGSVHKMAPVSFGDASVCILTSGLATIAFTVRGNFIRNFAR